jgi:hypothetical protein
VPPRKLKPEIPEPVEAIVLKAMEKDRDRRYPTAEALAADLERFLGNGEVEARLPGLSSIIVRRIRRNLLPASLGFALLVALGVGLVAWAGRSSSAWIDAFRTERRGLEYASFKAGDAELPGRIHALLTQPGPPSSGDGREASDWFRAQIDIAERDGKAWPLRPHSEWSMLKESAARARAWCEAASLALAGTSGDLEALGSRLPPLRAALDSLLSYKGEFRLKIGTQPGVTVKDLRRRGQSVTLKDRQTPLLLEDLEIDDYEIELSHPKYPGVTLSISASTLADGMTYSVMGDLRKEGSIQFR